MCWAFFYIYCMGPKHRSKGVFEILVGDGKRPHFSVFYNQRALAMATMTLAPASSLLVMVMITGLTATSQCKLYPQTVLRVTSISHLTANKWKRANTFRWDDLFLKHQVFV